MFVITGGVRGFVFFSVLCCIYVFSRRTSRIVYSKQLNRRNPMKLNMVFDFIRKRSEEGIAQVQNIASKTLEGKLVEALTDSAEYVRSRRIADLESLKRLTDGLAKSRARLLMGINGIFEDKSLAVEARLDKLEEVLLQADIGAATSAAIVSDLKQYALRESLEVDDIFSVLRRRLIESLTVDSGSKGLNFVSSEGDIKVPTVIFVIGANGA